MTRVCVAMATYNEAETIGQILSGLDFKGWTVVIVDDNSPDGTADIARAYPRACVHVRKHERGIATAYRLALQLALEQSPKWVIQMDAGGTHRPVDAWFMADQPNADLVIGSRFFIPVKSRGFRTWISKGAAALMRLRGVQVSDATSGFRCWRSDLLEKVIDRPFVSRGFAFQLETLYQAYRMGARIKETSIPYRLTNSSFRPQMLREALQVYFELGRLYG